MTFDETINSLTPAFKHIALIEPWTMGGTIGKFVVRHHDDLPKVFGYVWKFHPDYDGPLEVGDLVFHPRYAAELIASGSQEVDGKQIHWDLCAIDTDVIEAVVLRDAATQTAAEVSQQVKKEGTNKERHGRTYPRACKQSRA